MAQPTITPTVKKLTATTHDRAFSDDSSRGGVNKLTLLASHSLKSARHFGSVAAPQRTASLTVAFGTSSPPLHGTVLPAAIGTVFWQGVATTEKGIKVTSKARTVGVIQLRFLCIDCLHGCGVLFGSPGPVLADHLKGCISCPPGISHGFGIASPEEAKPSGPQKGKQGV